MAREQDGYDSFESFLRAAIKAYWSSNDGSRINFLALLLASREAWQVAWGQATSSPGRIMTGAAGAAAIAVLLRTFLGGPIGILLGGASIASLVAVYVRNHQRIWAQVGRYRRLIDIYRGRYENLRADYAEGRIDKEQRDLMIDGLMSRFLAEVDEEPEEEHAGSPSGQAHGEEHFADHVARQRDSAEDEPRHDESDDSRDVN